MIEFKYLQGIAEPGFSTAFGAQRRRFESSYPDYFKSRPVVYGWLKHTPDKGKSTGSSPVRSTNKRKMKQTPLLNSKRKFKKSSSKNYNSASYKWWLNLNTRQNKRKYKCLQFLYKEVVSKKHMKDNEYGFQAFVESFSWHRCWNLATELRRFNQKNLTDAELISISTKALQILR